MLGRGVNPLSPKTALPCLVPLRVSELVEGKPFDRSLRGVVGLTQLLTPRKCSNYIKSLRGQERDKTKQKVREKAESCFVREEVLNIPPSPMH